LKQNPEKATVTNVNLRIITTKLHGFLIRKSIFLRVLRG